jgi:hypothetical protein
MIYPVRCILLAGAISIALLQIPRNRVVDPGIINTNNLVRESADATLVKNDTMQESFDELKYNKYLAGPITTNIQTLHPFLVSFALSLILVAALLQLLNIFTFNQDIAWIVFLLILGGLAIAVISGKNQQVYSASDGFFLIEDLEEKWTDWNIRTAFLALVLQVVHLFLTKFDKVLFRGSGRRVALSYRTNRIFMTIIAILILTSAFKVIQSGMGILNPPYLNLFQP